MGRCQKLPCSDFKVTLSFFLIEEYQYTIFPRIVSEETILFIEIMENQKNRMAKGKKGAKI